MRRRSKPSLARERLYWLAAGLLMGLGGLIAQSWLGVAMMLVGLTAAFAGNRLVGARQSWIAITAAAAPIAIGLYVAAVNRAGCPGPGETIVLKEGKPRVDCGDILASYWTFAIFFTLVALVGLALPWLIRRREAMLDREATEVASSNGHPPSVR